MPFYFFQGVLPRIEWPASKSQVVVKLTPAQRKAEKTELDRIEREVRAELDHPPPSELAIRLRVARKAAGLSLADVGEASSMPLRESSVLSRSERRQ